MLERFFRWGLYCFGAYLVLIFPIGGFQKVAERYDLPKERHEDYAKVYLEGQAQCLIGALAGLVVLAAALTIAPADKRKRRYVDYYKKGELTIDRVSDVDGAGIEVKRKGKPVLSIYRNDTGKTKVVYLEEGVLSLEELESIITHFKEKVGEEYED